MRCLRFRIPILLLILNGVGILISAEETPVKVVLKDGRELFGRLIREDENAIFLLTEEGEERGITRTRIERVVKAPVIPDGKSVETKAGDEAHQKWLAENRAILGELKDLGDPARDKRNAALHRVGELGKRAEPLLLGILHPREKMSVELRIGALRGLAVLGVLSPEGAQSLAWIATKDADAEVRREACRTIRLLNDERAVGMILQFSVEKEGGTQRAAARALREIDDVRALAALVAALPPGPEVSSSMPTAGPSPQGEWRELPAGPYGQQMPVFMPQQQATSGTASVGHPASEALSLIAGKNLGNHAGVWHYWLRQKIGVLTREDLENESPNHSLRDRMNVR